MTKTQFKKDLKKALLKIEGLEKDLKNENILQLETITSELEANDFNKIINFEIEERTSGNEYDRWYQIEYWSKKLNKIIIFEHDFVFRGTTINELVDILTKYQYEIKEFKNKIQFN